MKKLLLVCLLLSFLGVEAQHKPFQFGFKAGANLGWFRSSADNYENQGSAFGAAWGFVADVYLMENYAFTTGFDVVFLNGTLEYPSRSADAMDGILTRKYRSKYIELPLAFTMKTNEIKGLRYYGQIGFGLGFLLSAKGKDSFLPDDSNAPITNDHDITGDMKFFRTSLLLGGGVEIPLSGDTYLRTGIKYDNAFSNVLSGDNAMNPDEKNSARSNFIEVNVAVIF
ncbi:MAG: porin family protein [Bacteroidales bacterium]|nr:porin family protein [Bacteroidales bacterium]